MKKILFFLSLAVLFAGGWFVLQGEYAPKNIPAASDVSNGVSVEKESEAVEPAFATPQRLIISSIDVDAYVESVGLDRKGNMDIPKQDENVAWYNLGYKLGEAGNTVLAGHFDTKTGAPAVFYKLESLKEGDKMLVKGDTGAEYIYTVSHITTYAVDRFPLEEVFGPHDKNRLVLITCEGSFNSATRNYSHRTVVYADFVE